MPLKTEPFDPADYLDTPEACAAYLSEAFATGDAAFAMKAISHVVKATSRSVSGVAANSGVGRVTLTRALQGQTTPGIDTVLKLLEAMDMQIEIKTKHRDAA